MSDFVEWTPKHHGHQPLHWTPDMLTSVDGKNFVRQPNWAWIAGSTYYVPREAVELPRIEPEPEQTDRTNYCTGCKDRQDRIEALTADKAKLHEALEAAPIIGLWEGDEAFRVRQDRWLKTKYRAALEKQP